MTMKHVNNQSNFAILLGTCYSVSLWWLLNLVPEHIFKIKFFKIKFKLTVAFLRNYKPAIFQNYPCVELTVFKLPIFEITLPYRFNIKNYLKSEIKSKLILSKSALSNPKFLVATFATFVATKTVMSPQYRELSYKTTIQLMFWL